MRSIGTLGLANTWQRALLAGAVAVVLPGCLVPIEDEATIAGRWTVNGGTASAASCAVLDIDAVQLNLYRGASTVPYETLEAPCASGIIDSREAFGSFIASGNYQYDFVAIRRSAEVGRNARSNITLAAGDHGQVFTDFSSGMSFNPVGSDATGEATWTIDGAPANAANCAALGITTVRIAFQNGTEWFAHPGLTASCAAGRIDTRPNAVIRAGSWQMQVQALNAAGEIFPGMIESRNVTAGSHVVMQPTIFSSGAFMPLGSDASVSASWRLNARAPTANSCYAVGADRVRISLFAATDTAFESGVTVYQANCATGALDSGSMNVVRAGRYLWALEAIDSTGAIIVEYSEATPVDITVGSRVMFPTVDFMFPTTVTFDIGWTAGSDPARPVTTCAAAGVQTMGYSLQRGVTIIDSSTSRPCADLMSWDSSAFPALTPGDYQLTVQGFNSTGRKQWDVLPGECTLRVDALGLVSTDCTALFTP